MSARTPSQVRYQNKYKKIDWYCDVCQMWVKLQHKSTHCKSNGHLARLFRANQEVEIDNGDRDRRWLVQVLKSVSAETLLARMRDLEKENSRNAY